MVGEFLRTILVGTGQITVDEVAYDGAAGTEAAMRHQPDVVLMDLRMPGIGGVTATTEIRSLPDPPVVIAMTTLDTDEHVLTALEAGASGFILKTTPSAQLVPLVLAAAAGTSVLSPEALQRLRCHRHTGPAVSAGRQVDGLSERESEVLALVAEGLSNADIASRLYLSEGTVKGSVSRLMALLDCKNRTQLALRVVQPPE
jgi:DNA-binding NarL/FixJ family response regulator